MAREPHPHCVYVTPACLGPLRDKMHFLKQQRTGRLAGRERVPVRWTYRLTPTGKGQTHKTRSSIRLCQGQTSNSAQKEKNIIPQDKIQAISTNSKIILFYLSQKQGTGSDFFSQAFSVWLCISVNYHGEVHLVLYLLCWDVEARSKRLIHLLAWKKISLG